MNILTVSFFGHRDFIYKKQHELVLKKIIIDLLQTYDHVNFLVGRNGEFDIFVSSMIRETRKEYSYSNFSLTWVLPYATSDFLKNQIYYEKYYDDIEICYKSSMSHFKSAIRIRNIEMVDRSDLIICNIEHNSGGAFKTIQYAQKISKKIINIYNIINCDDFKI